MFETFTCWSDAAQRGSAKRRVRAAFVPRSGTNALRGEAAQLHAAAAGGCVRAHAPRRVFANLAVMAGLEADVTGAAFCGVGKAAGKLKAAVHLLRRSRLRSSILRFSAEYCENHIAA